MGAGCWLLVVGFWQQKQGNQQAAMVAAVDR
jgi:hypothetical protein